MSIGLTLTFSLLSVFAQNWFTGINIKYLLFMGTGCYTTYTEINEARCHHISCYIQDKYSTPKP